jgi:hypothetical protein
VSFLRRYSKGQKLYHFKNWRPTKITGPTISLLIKSMANQTKINKLPGKIPNKKGRKPREVCSL